jgi:hypothetical protein
MNGPTWPPTITGCGLRAGVTALALTPALLALTPAIVALALGRVPGA